MTFTTKMVNVFTTTRCTLNCKYCGSAVPKFRAADITYDADVRQVKASIDALFKVYDHIEHLDFTGGEPLLWGGLPECLCYASRYKDKFDFMRVLTNATLLPSNELLSTINALDCKFDFFIDNYGKHSCKVNELKSLLNRNDIDYRETRYDGEIQDYGGWIDFGDMTFKGYSSEKAKLVYDNCLQAHHMCLTLFDGNLYNCTIAPIGNALGKIPRGNKDEFVPLLDESVSLEKKRQIAGQFGHHVLKACLYCNGFDNKNAPRFPAAEQA